MANNLETLFSMRTTAENNDGIQWYSTAREYLEVIAKNRKTSLKVVAGMVAALSPRVNWKTNLYSANNMLKGKKIRGLSKNIEKAEAIKKTGIVLKYLKGPKVTSFFLNLIGNESEVTIDTLMINAYHNHFERISVTKAERDDIVSTVQSIARRHKMTCAQVQAIIWVVWHRVTKSNFPGYVALLKIF